VSISIKLLTKSNWVSIEKEWLELAKQVGTHFLHYPGWYKAQINAYPETDIFFAAVYRFDELVSVVPLQIIKQKTPLGSLSILGLAYENEMGVTDCLANGYIENPLKTILKAVKNNGIKYNVARFRCVVESGCFISFTTNVQNIFLKKTHNSKYLDVSEGMEAFYNNYSSKFKRNLRRKKSKAEEIGSIGFRSTLENIDLDEAYAIFLWLEDSGWKGDRGTSIIKQPDKSLYYQTLLESYSSYKNICINLLYLDKEPIAAQFGVISGETLYLLKIAYNEQYSQISPGYLIVDQLIQSIDEHHLYKKISFVTSVDWADRWKPKGDQTWLIYYFNSAIAYYSLKTAFRLRGLFNLLRGKIKP